MLAPYNIVSPEAVYLSFTQKEKPQYSKPMAGGCVVTKDWGQCGYFMW